VQSFTAGSEFLKMNALKVIFYFREEACPGRKYLPPKLYQSVRQYLQNVLVSLSIGDLPQQGIPLF
jgi:hypothetical protein